MMEVLEYQRVSDSPTVKHYTDWSAYEPFAGTLSRCPGDGFSYEASGDVRDGPRSIGALLPADESKLAAMHYAALGGFRSISIGGSASLALEPRGIECGSTVSRHSAILVEPGANVDLRITLGGGAGKLDLSFVELVLGEGSTANVLIYLGSTGGAPSAAGLRAALGRRARLNYVLLGSGGPMHHQDDRVLLGPSSALRAGAFLISPGGSRVDRFLGVDHAGEDSSSSASAMGIALGGGYSVMRGIARIEEGAARSRTEFTAGVALMGEGARGYAVPMLEVHTGDVLEARHHSFEAKPDADQLFYLRSRGLKEDEARDLIIAGWAEAQLSALEGALAGVASGLLGEVMRAVTSAAPTSRQ
jgi:hypothetical protein